MEFLNYINTLENLYSQIKLPQNNSSRKEVPFSNGISMNYSYSYIGKYFTGKHSTIWIGYYEPYGLCVSFLDNKDTSTSVEEKMKNEGYEFICSKGYADEGYWYTIKMSEAFKKQDKKLQNTDMYSIANKIINLFD